MIDRSKIIIILLCIVIFSYYDIQSVDATPTQWWNDTRNFFTTITIVPDRTMTNGTFLLLLNSSVINFDNFNSPRGEEFAFTNNETDLEYPFYIETPNISLVSFTTIPVRVKVQDMVKGVPQEVIFWHGNNTPVEPRSSCSHTAFSCVDHNNANGWSNAGSVEITGVNSSAFSNESYLRFFEAAGGDTPRTLQLRNLTGARINLSTFELVYRYRINNTGTVADAVSLQFGSGIPAGNEQFIRNHMLRRITTPEACTAGTDESGAFMICNTNMGGSINGTIAFGNESIPSPDNFTKNVWWKTSVRFNSSNTPDLFENVSNTFFNMDMSFNRTIFNSSAVIKRYINNVSIGSGGGGEEMDFHLQFLAVYNLSNPVVTIGDTSTKAVTACGGLSNTTAMTLNTFDEFNVDTPIVSDVEILIQHVVSGLPNNISFTFSGNSTYSICLFPENSVFEADTTILYSAPSFRQRTFFHNDITLSNDTLIQPLYLINESVGELIDISIVDSTNLEVPDAFVNILRHYVGNDTFRTVAISKTDFDGKAVTYLALNDVLYKFVIIKDGVIIEDIDPTFITSNNVNIQVDPSAIGNIYSILQNVVSTCSFSNVTGSITCSLTDIESTTRTACLDVVQIVDLGEIDICNECATGTSLTVVCPVGNITDRLFFFDFSIEGSSIPQVSGFLQDQQAENLFGAFGLVAAIMIILFLALIADGPSMMIIDVVIGIGALTIFGFINIIWAGAVGLTMAGALMIYVLRK